MSIEGRLSDPVLHAIFKSMLTHRAQNMLSVVRMEMGPSYCQRSHLLGHHRYVLEAREEVELLPARYHGNHYEQHGLRVADVMWLMGNKDWETAGDHGGLYHSIFHEIKTGHPVGPNSVAEIVKKYDGRASKYDRIGHLISTEMPLWVWCWSKFRNEAILNTDDWSRNLLKRGALRFMWLDWLLPFAQSVVEKTDFMDAKGGAR